MNIQVVYLELRVRYGQDMFLQYYRTFILDNVFLWYIFDIQEDTVLYSKIMK